MVAETMVEMAKAHLSAFTHNRARAGQRGNINKNNFQPKVGKAGKNSISNASSTST
jgi:hypothetical protein